MRKDTRRLILKLYNLECPSLTGDYKCRITCSIGKNECCLFCSRKECPWRCTKVMELLEEENREEKK